MGFGSFVVFFFEFFFEIKLDKKIVGFLYIREVLGI